MPKAEYTESELWVKDGLERLFWIEIAKRKARLCQGDVFSQLLGLRAELESFFGSFSSELDEPCEGGEEVVLNIVQFGKHMLNRVSDPQHAELIKKATKEFGRRAWVIKNNLDHYRGFWLSDFSIETDLALLHDWWSYIISTKGRQELNARGRFSTHGECRPVIATEELKFEGEEEPTIRVGDPVNTISSLQAPVRFPERVRPRGVYAYTTDEHEVTIDGHELKDRVVLEFDLLKPLPPMRQIEALLRITQRGAKALRMVERLNRGVYQPYEDCDSEGRGERLLLDLMTDPPESHELMGAFTSARPMIAGLACWDLVAAGMSDARAADRVARELLGVDDAQVLHQRQVVRALKDVVRPRVQAYESSKLPWNLSEEPDFASR